VNIKDRLQLRLTSSVPYIGTRHSDLHFYPEDTDSIFLRSFGTYLSG